MLPMIQETCQCWLDWIRVVYDMKSDKVYVLIANLQVEDERDDISNEQLKKLEEKIGDVPTWKSG